MTWFWIVQVPLLRPSPRVTFLTAFLRQVFSLTCSGFLSFMTAIPGKPRIILQKCLDGEECSPVLTVQADQLPDWES